MCTSSGGKPFVMGGLMPGKYIQNSGFVPKNANSAPKPPPVPPSVAAQRIRPYALGRDFVIPTGNVRSR